jgi:hypothetical protein
VLRPVNTVIKFPDVITSNEYSVKIYPIESYKWL